MKYVVGVLVIGLVVLTLSSWGAADGAEARDRSGREGGGRAARVSSIRRLWRGRAMRRRPPADRPDSTGRKYAA